MKLRDFLSEQESNEFDKLQLDLLNAVNSREQLIVQTKIDELLDTARSRYQAYLAEKEQAAAGVYAHNC